MSRHQFHPDRLTMGIAKVTHRFFEVLRGILYVIGAGIFVTILCYAVFTMVFRTDTERRLIRENRMYEQTYSEMQQEEDLIRDAVGALQYKDSDIYEQVFHSSAPNVDPMSTLDFLFASDSIPEKKFISYTREKSDELISRVAAVDATFANIFGTLSNSDLILPPMSLPLDGVTYPQVGASVGSRMNPFFKAYVEHDGLDFIVVSGTPVFAAADGVVGSGTGSFKDTGKTVEIVHSGSYVTCYAHLETILVGRGQKVSRGQKIGTVGVSGRSYAPHLHFEVIRDGQILDPINYIFADVSPEEYANMLYMSVNTMQSMD